MMLHARDDSSGGFSRSKSRCGDSPSSFGAFGFDLEDDDWFGLLRGVGDRRPMGRIGPYELLGELGRGGQGIVFKARQPRTGREIALKRVAAGSFATPEMRARFEREIEAVAALDHPNIVTVYGSDIVDGQPVLAMRWVDGVPFDRWAWPADGARREIREILAVFALVCDAIHHAHQRGVIHRDVKPSNILVDREDRPNVLDFGLARIQLEAGSGMTLTDSGQFLGTPAFAAPEQIRGELREIDVRTDVYALGALLYCALTGRTVFDPALPLARLIREMPMREPPRPSIIEPTIDREIDAIVQKALAHDKEQRYASVDGLATDIRRYLAGQTVLAHPPSHVYRMRKFMRQHRAWVLAAASFVVLLIAATATSTTLYFRAERERKKADEARKAEAESAEAQRAQVHRSNLAATKATAANLLLDDMLVKANRGARAGHADVTVRDVLNLVSQELDEGRRRYEPDVEAYVRMTIANAFSELGLNDAAEPHYLKAMELRRTFSVADPLALAETHEKLGRLYRREGRLDDAERMLDEALRLRRENISSADDGYFAVNLNSLGLLKRQQHKLQEAEQLTLESLDLYRRLFGPEDESVPVVLHNLASVYLDSGRAAQAEPLLYEAHALALKLHGQLHADVALIETALATACRANGNSAAAERFALQALATFKLVYGDRHPRVAATQLRLAEVLMAKKEHAGAEEMYCEAVAGFRAAQLPQDLARALPAYARLLNARGKHREAAECCSEALAIANIAFYLPAEEIANLRALQSKMYNVTVVASQPPTGGPISTP